MIIIECCICGKDFETVEGSCKDKEKVCDSCCSTGWCDMCK